MLTRRRLLTRSALLGAIAAAAPPLIWQAQTPSGSAEGAPAAAPAERTLVIVQLAGGNDTLNTFIPYKDPLYPSVQPALHVDLEKILPLDDAIGLNPALSPLKAFWDAGKLGIIQGVGYSNPTYSHFSSMAIWQTAAPKGEFSDGWIGRYFKRAGADSKVLFRGLNAGNSVAPMLETPGIMVPSIQNPDAYRLALDPQDAQARLDVWEDLQAATKSGRKYLPLIGDAAANAYRGTKVLSQSVSSYKPAVDYANDRLSNSLRLLAAMIVQQPGTKVAYAMDGGYDSHSNERRSHDGLLTNLARALSAFQRDLEAHGKADDVLIVTWSEFGRRVKENASLGTDHGNGGSMLVLGNHVRRGIYGETPDLSKLDSNGSLRTTTDFRSVYATLLQDWLGVESQPILGDRFKTIPFVAN
jgi:uncharacterized protein (DUF1501 family)